MPQLKAGTVNDFADSMGAEIEAAFGEELWELKRERLPSQDMVKERRLLFVAIAQGVLRYLKKHENEFITTITTTAEAQSTVTQLELNIPPPP